LCSCRYFLDETTKTLSKRAKDPVSWGINRLLERKGLLQFLRRFLGLSRTQAYCAGQFFDQSYFTATNTLFVLYVYA
jgi:hypothetical protein